MKHLDTSHSFPPFLAKELGCVYKAILLKEIFGWCRQNKLNNRNVDEFGDAWTYQSSEAFAEKFFYMTPSSIRRRLNQLEDDGWLVSRVANKKGYDKTKSYKINIEKYSKILIAQIEQWTAQNGQSIAQIEQPIPSSNKSSNKNIIYKEKLNPVETKNLLLEYLDEKENIEALNNSVMKSFPSLDAAKEFYISVASSLCETGMAKYRYNFYSLNDVLAKLQSWAKRAKFSHIVGKKHRLADEYSVEEVEASKNYAISNLRSEAMKKEIQAISYNKLMNFFSPLLALVKEKDEFKGLDALTADDLLLNYTRFRNKRNHLKKIMEEKRSYAPKYKSVANFIEKQIKFIY